MAVLYGALSVMRLRSGILFDKYVNRATAAQEVFIFWLYLCIALHELSGTTVSVSILILMVTLGLLFTCGAVYLSERRVAFQAMRYSSKTDAQIEKYGETEALLSFYSLHLLMNSVEEKNLNGENIHATRARIKLNGVFANHLESCQSANCQCNKLICEFETRV